MIIKAFTSRRRVLLALIALASASAVAAGASVALSAHDAHAAPAWTLQWSDEFNGAASTGVSSTNWLYDLGKGYGCAGCPTNWGTGELDHDRLCGNMGDDVIWAGWDGDECLGGGWFFGGTDQVILLQRHQHIIHAD